MRVRRTFLTAIAAIASGKKVRLSAVETMKNLEKNARKKGAFHHQLMNGPTEISPAGFAIESITKLINLVVIPHRVVVWI